MDKIGILITSFTLSLIILVGCNQAGPLDSLEPTMDEPNIENSDEVKTPAAQPSGKPASPVNEENIEPTRPELDDTPTIPTEREEPVPTEPSNSIPTDTRFQSSVQKALQDLSKRLNIPVDQIEVLEVREVVWSDASLGCPQPGYDYAQVLQEGLLIRLGVGNRMYFYHSGGSREPFLCEQTSQIVPKTTPKDDEFVPPPGSEID